MKRKRMARFSCAPSLALQASIHPREIDQSLSKNCKCGETACENQPDVIDGTGKCGTHLRRDRGR